MNPTLAPTRRDAFSLIEVTLALGILVFACVALLGLIPVGLRTFESAVDATVQAQIMQRISTVARQSKFSELSKLNSDPATIEKREAPDFFFDDQGVEVTDTAAISQKKYIYTAAVTVQQPTSVPAASGQQRDTTELATVTLIIGKITAPKESSVVSLFIANNGL